MADDLRERARALAHTALAVYFDCEMLDRERARGLGEPRMHYGTCDKATEAIAAALLAERQRASAIPESVMTAAREVAHLGLGPCPNHDHHEPTCSRWAKHIAPALLAERQRAEAMVAAAAMSVTAAGDEMHKLREERDAAFSRVERVKDELHAEQVRTGRLETERDAALDALATERQRGVEAGRAEYAPLWAIALAFVDTVDREAEYRESRGKGGQQVSWNGELSACGPSAFAALKRWARDFRDAKSINDEEG